MINYLDTKCSMYVLCDMQLLMFINMKTQLQKIQFNKEKVYQTD